MMSSSETEEFTVVPTVQDDVHEETVDAEEPDEKQLLNDEIIELRTELQVKEAECIEYDMELTLVKSECEDLKAELARAKQLAAKSEAERMRSIVKYNKLLDEMRGSPNQMEAALAQYKSKADDLEDSIEEQRAAWLNTGQLLKDQTEETARKSVDLREEIAQLNKSLDEERKRVSDITEQLESAQTQSEEWERNYKDIELKLAAAKNTHTDVVDMYRQQSEHLQRMATVEEHSITNASDSFEHVEGEVDKREIVVA